jgi:replicative DNA helicase
VLGAILLSDRTLYGLVIEDALRPEDFYREQHRIVYRAMLELYEQSEPVDQLTLLEHLRQTGHLEEAGGEAAVAALAGSVPPVANLRSYAQIVKENALMRELLSRSFEIQASVLEHQAAPRELVERAERSILEVAHDDRRQDFRSLDDILDSELDKLHRLSIEHTALTGTPSGFKDLDELTGGFQAGNLVVIAARPSMGKSALVTNIAENAAIDHERGVALFSLEMSEAELAMRFIASQARVKGDDLSKGRAEKRWPKILEASQRLAQAPIYVDDSSDVGILEVRAKARRLHSQSTGGLGLIIVDYLQLMRADHRVDNRAEQVGQMSRGLKILARELDVPVLALSQLNRGVEARTDKRPLLSDLRESGCLAGGSRVYLPDSGTYVPIRELVGRSGFRVLALNHATWKLERCTVSKAFSTGRKPVARLTTARGRSLHATANHRFLTIDGWRRLDELAPGMHLAVPRQPSGSAMPTPGRGSPSPRGNPYGAFSDSETDATTSTATLVRESVEAPQLADDGDSDVYWDQVAAIDPGSEQEVYDLTVAGLHNFIVDDIVVHNSIEQDADVVVFIYRDEYYNKEESEHQGEAELLVAKHRNGPLGKVVLTFQEQYPKFMNFAGERFAA